MKLDEFKELREYILNEYDILLSEKIITDIVATERTNNFRNKRFIVSVCGQIKAGKSTLLNALLFGGEEILPSDDTPHTAKLTLINYAKTPYFDAVFYTEQEWSEVKKSYLDKGLEKVFEKECCDAIEKGCFAKEYLGQERTIDELSKLKEYVSVVKEGCGVYTPYVKQVNLFYPAELLREVTIVDTPGINDPNIIRGNITKDWIHNSHAVIYAMYANQVFDTTDWEFISENLLGIDKSHLLYAINKIDLVNNMAELDAWIKGLAESADSKARDFFQDKKSIQKVCALGGLLQRIEGSGKQIPEQYDWHYKKLKNKDWLSDKNGMGELSGLMQERIIKTKGRGLLKSEVAFIKGKYTEKLRELHSAIKQEELISLPLYDKSIEELEERIQELHIRGKKIITSIRETTLGIQEICENAENARNDEKIKINKNMVDNISYKLRDVNSLTQIQDSSLLILSGELDIAKSKIYIALQSTKKRVETELEQLKNKINFIDSDFSSIFQGIFEGTNETLKKIFDDLKTTAEIKMKVEAAIKENTSWWGRFFGTKEARDKGRFSAKVTLCEQGQMVTKATLVEIAYSIFNNVNKITPNIATECQDIIEKIKNNLNKQKASKETQETKKQKIEALIKEYQGKILHFQKLQSVFEQEIGQRGYSNV